MIGINTVSRFRIFADSCRLGYQPVLLVILALGLGACSGDPRPLQEAVEANDVDLRRLEISAPGQDLDERGIWINPGDNLQFDFKAFNADNEEIELSKENRRWAVSVADIADIDDNGLLRGLVSQPGVFFDVALQIGSIVSPPIKVSVSLSNLASINLKLGDDAILGEGVANPESAELTECSISEKLTATGQFEDGSQRPLLNLEWSVPESASGLLVESTATDARVGALTQGGFNLKVQSGELISDVPFTVVAGLEEIVIAPEEPTVAAGGTEQLHLDATYVQNPEGEAQRPQRVTDIATWSTIGANSEIATFTNIAGLRGVVSGVTIGSTQVEAKCGNDAVAAIAALEVVQPVFTSLEIDPSDSPLVISLDRNREVQLRVIAKSDGNAELDVSNQASWFLESGDGVITVDDGDTTGGLVTALTVGVARIKVTYRSLETFLSVRVDE